MTLLEHQKLLENQKLPQRNKSNQAWAKAVIWGAIMQLLKSLFEKILAVEWKKYHTKNV